ncbi:MAG: enoyl-CoA hydratase [Phycisphaerae bacterium]|nr:MAG: enoyl-CoA hydratase/isomerase family protein [Planctomycetia bacterium]RIK69058.1 MAG: enoyl-CoA hydratase [Planctomycetota bacterium]GJQ27485.1 MAG: enoyl-CoA hydratase [Phycisphaerae bacterium]
MSDDFVLLEKEGAVAVLRLNRPDVLNALNIPTMDRLITLMESLDGDRSVHCIVLTGSDKAFAAGADIKEMAEASVMDMYERNNLARWERIKRVRTPIIAAVSGFCLGGGCELAMHCDIITASETAKFGQPEINLGVMPGAGGTQRLSKVVGKYRAMELILTGRFFDANEALRLGLVTHVWPVKSYLKETLALAQQIAEKSPVATRVAKEAVLRAFETGLSDGLEYERKLFYMLFATEDQKEGMKAFVEKRKPTYTGR